MENGKQFGGFVISWNEQRGFGFVGFRDPSNPQKRFSWFVHVTQVESIGDSDGLIRSGAPAKWNEGTGPKGTMAIQVEVLPSGGA
jgi:hypothetical protein